MVAFGVTAVDVGSAWCSWPWQESTCKMLLARPAPTNLELFLARGVLRHSGHGLEMEIFAKFETRFVFL